MIEFESALRTSLRASFAAIDVPAAPSFAQPVPTRRRVLAAALACAAAITLSFAVKTQGPALARTFGQTLSFFVRSAGSDRRAAVPMISFAEALRTPEFAVVPPAGLPDGARFESAQRFAQHGTSPIVVFHYRVHGAALLVVEVHELQPGDAWKSDASEAGSDVTTSVRNTAACASPACSDQMTMFRLGTTSVLVAASEGALAADPGVRATQIGRIEAAMRRERPPAL